MYYIYKISDPYNKDSLYGETLFSGSLKHCLEWSLILNNTESYPISIVDSNNKCVAGYGHKFYDEIN